MPIPSKPRSLVFAFALACAFVCGAAAAQAQSVSPLDQVLRVIQGAVGAPTASGVATRGQQTALPRPPGRSQVMRDLFGATATHAGARERVRVPVRPGSDAPNLQAVQPWLAATVTLNGRTYHLATVQGYEIDPGSDDGPPGVVSSAWISAAWYVVGQGGNHWTLAGRAFNVASDGTAGMLVGYPGAPFDILARNDGAVVLGAGEQGMTNQGYMAVWVPLLAFDGRSLKLVGDVPTGGDDEGTGVPSKVSITGHIVDVRFAPHVPMTVTVRYSGTIPQNETAHVLAPTTCQLNAVADAHNGTRQFRPVTAQCKAIVSAMSF